MLKGRFIEFIIEKKTLSFTGDNDKFYFNLNKFEYVCFCHLREDEFHVEVGFDNSTFTMTCKLAVGFECGRKETMQFMLDKFSLCLMQGVEGGIGAFSMYVLDYKLQE